MAEPNLIRMIDGTVVQSACANAALAVSGMTTDASGQPLFTRAFWLPPTLTTDVFTQGTMGTGQELS